MTKSEDYAIGKVLSLQQVVLGKLNNYMQDNEIWTLILHYFPHSSVGKDLFSMQETQVQFWGQEELLEKELATHSSILSWRIPSTKEPGWILPMVSQETDTT